MLVSNQIIEIKWGRTNVSHYKKLGYKFTKLGDSFMVKAEDLMPTSKAQVEILCDSCGKKCLSTYQSYLTSISLHNNEYYCRNCVQRTVETQKKKENTCLIKYGCKIASQNEEIKNKTKETNLQNNGYEYPTQSPIIKEKIKQSFLLNQTLCGFQNPEVLQKAQEKISENNLHKISSQQLFLFQQLKEYYSNIAVCELNRPCSTLNLDIALELEEQKIDIEVDGVYWHQDKNKDRRRDEYVKQQGYKVLRIKINHKLPPITDIVDAINNLLNSKHSFYTIMANDIKQTK